MTDIIIPESSKLYEKLANLAKVFESPESVLERIIDAYDSPMEDKPTNTKPTNTKIAKPKQKITLDVIKEIYPLAKDVYEGRKKLDDALNELEKIMYRGSALMYVNVFKAMRQGESYTRTMNTTATRYFLEQIREDYQEEGLKLALNALNAHIEYFEGFIGEGKMKTTGEIRDEFTAKL